MSQKHEETDAYFIRELTNEADLSRPRFSQELHEKIMSRIVHSRASQRSLPRRSRLFISGGLAASVALIVGLLVSIKHFRPINPSSAPVATAEKLPTVPIIQNPIRALELPAVCQIAAADYSDVDQDGEKLLSYMSRQLDVLPTRKSSDGVGQRE
jgi:hypothetical protein